MSKGKNINLFLMDGKPNARIKCTLANWTGVAYKIPRTELEKCKSRTDLKQSGVYFLFGVSDENDDVVYIGQAGVRKNGEGILNRLIEHKRNADKNYWTEAVVFITSNNSFGATDISYLESRFCELANVAKRYKIQNGNEPMIGNVTEEKGSELEEFIENAKIIMGTLGYNIFEPIYDLQNDSDQDQQINQLFMKQKSRKSGQLIEAIGQQTVEGFVVLKGSRIETNNSESIPKEIKIRRERANIIDGVLQDNELFNSPSYAGAFVIGGHINGREAWKNKDGKSLKEIENES